MDLHSSQSFLFVPKLPDSYATWMGPMAVSDPLVACRQAAVLWGHRAAGMHLPTSQGADGLAVPYAARACCLLPSASVALLAHCCTSLPLNVWPQADPTGLYCCTDVSPSQNAPLLQSLDELTAKYAVSEVHYVDDMAGVLAGLKPVCLHVLEGQNSDR